jgi:hypothetical protein
VSRNSCFKNTLGKLDAMSSANNIVIDEIKSSSLLIDYSRCGLMKNVISLLLAHADTGF